MTPSRVAFNRDLLGVELAAGTMTVTREQILGYCQAVGETNPLYTDERVARQRGHPSLLAPPLLCTLFERHLKRPDIQLDFPGLQLDAGKSVESLGPVHAGDTLEARIRLKDVYIKTGRSGAMAFIQWEVNFYNGDGTVVTRMTENWVRHSRSQPRCRR